MAPPQCPVCHQNTAFAGRVAYCPACGWNRDSAISAAKMSITVTPLAMFMFAAMAAYMYWGMKFSRAPQLLLFILFPIAFIPLNYLSLRRRLAKLKTLPSQPSAVHSNFNLAAENAPSAAPAFPPSAQDEVLLRTPAPRQIRVSKQGRFTLWVASLALLAFFIPFAASLYSQWSLYHSFSDLRGLGWGIAIECVVALAAFGIWRGRVKECDLLEHGEAVMGRVVRQWTDEKRNSSIQYEFTDFLGSSHTGAAFDRTNQLFAGMPLLVFYDRDNPKRQIAYCSTLHEVIPPAVAAPAREAFVTK